MLRFAGWLFALAACGFRAPASDPDAEPSTDDGGIEDGDGADDGGLGDGDGAGDGGTPVDAPIAITDDVVHVASADERIGSADLMVDAMVNLDTTSLGISSALPAGVTLTFAGQDPAGPQVPEIAILRVRTLTLTSAGRLRVLGDRPLVILAEEIIVNGVIDAGGRGQQAGAGAAERGPGLGAPGLHEGTFDDTGGSGGGHGEVGGAGGDVEQTGPDLEGPTGGAAYNTDLAVLRGGARGGASWFTSESTACERRGGGGGGGAIQLYARSAIKIGVSGGIQVGGGGGRGGFACETPYNWFGGHGGGAGGAIYLQAPSVTNEGMLAANGGGGGAGGGAGADGVNPGESGNDGLDGALATTNAAGGLNTGTYSANGGRGGARGGSANPGDAAISEGNGGGGGGAVGRIVIRYVTAQTAGTTSPQPVVNPY